MYIIIKQSHCKNGTKYVNGKRHTGINIDDQKRLYSQCHVQVC